MNYLRTAIWLAVMTALFMGMGFLIGGKTGMGIAFLFSLAMNAFSYWNSDRVVLRMPGTQEVGAKFAPGFYDIVRQLADNAGLSMSRDYITHTPQPNAFATGRNPDHAEVAASTGLLETLSRGVVLGADGMARIGSSGMKR